VVCKHVVVAGVGGAGELLRNASANGLHAGVQLLLHMRISPLLTDPKARSALHLAAEHGHASVCKTLIDFGADAMTPDMHGIRPYDLSVQKRQHACRRIMTPFRQTADIEKSANEITISPLLGAARDGALEKIKAEVEGLQVTPDVKTEAVKVVADEDTHANGIVSSRPPVALCTNKGGITAIMAASIGRYWPTQQQSEDDAGHFTEVLQHLLECKDALGLLVDDVSASGATALTMAALEGELAAVDLLLAHGADVNGVDGEHFSPLMLAAMAGHVDVVTTLIGRGAKIDLTQMTDDKKAGGQSQSGRTALHWAAAQGESVAAKVLVDSGALVNALSTKKQTPLALACSQGHEEIVQLLVEADARLDYGDGKQTPLHLACEAGHENVARLLIEYLSTGRDGQQKGEGSKAWLNAPDSAGLAPLMLAARKGHTGMVRLLLQIGGNPLTKTSKGVTALMLACQQGYDSAAKVLIDSGAEIDSVTSDGKSALIYACEHVHTNVVVMLLKAGARPRGGNGALFKGYSRVRGLLKGHTS